MTLWRINLKPGAQAGIDSRKHCLTNGIVGIGWQVEYEKALKYTNVLLEIAPKSDVGLVQKGALSDWLAEGLRKKRIEQSNYFDEIDHARLQELQFQSQQAMMKVFGMGWKPETAAQREEYLKTIDKQKNNTDTSQ